MLCFSADRTQVLICHEQVGAHRLVKFPGGGLEWGEGILDCLHREAREELGLPIRVLGHFYTTEFFQPSVFRPNHQVISVYYRVCLADPSHETQLTSPEPDLRLEWRPVSQLRADDFTLPIDRAVADMLIQVQHPR